MAKDNEMTKAQELAVKALERMDDEGVRPLPHNYELWFRYFDQEPDIVGAVDKVKGGVDEDACYTIYERYVKNSAHEDAIRKISDHVHRAMTEVSALFSHMQDSTNEYSDTLQGVGDKISQAASADDIGEVVANLLRDTKIMVEHNNTLEEQLNNSSSQVAELRKNLDTVRKEAMTDGLTGLANRKSFDKTLRNAILAATDENEPLSLLMLDIDHFKSFNDNFGHQIGDQVLRLVARTLTDGIKGRDYAARYGGEEFAIILPDTPASAAVAVANSLRRSVESKEVINRSSNESLGKITMSIGVAEFEKGELMTDLIERADAALYTAKHNGRNQVAAAPSSKL